MIRLIRKRSRRRGLIRLIVLVILFLLSLLTVFRAPEFHLWMAAVIMTEYGYLFIPAVIALVVAGYRLPAYRTAGTLIGIATVALLCSPIVRAWSVAATLDEKLEAAFPGSRALVHAAGSPFSPARFFGTDDSRNVSFRTYRYAKIGGKRLDLDFYSSQSPGLRPCVIVIHGGSWKSGDSRQLPELNWYLSHKGFNVASIDYRLAPEFHDRDTQEDVMAAIRWLTSHARRLRLDPARLVLLGRSAGAQIALLAAYKLPPGTVRGVVDFYGPADMIWGYSAPSNPLIMNSRKVMSDYLGGTPREVPQAFADSSPLLAARQYAAPTLLLHGSNDVLVSPLHSVRLDSLLKRKRVPHFYLDLPRATHGFDYHLNGPDGQLSTYAILRFLEYVTR